ncbi:unnamed protein product [Mesocestoides corti]|uniref:Uncharacterized protein n=1 Tax=Mesocestoides corti TaxID=53468 RepID=A0A3P6HL63_MESCO|nr:unnamed protein product [Mesocestoides corti]
MDPEEFDYLLPNEAVVGFFLTVDDSRDQAISPIMEMKHYERSIDILQPQVDIDDLFVGSQFQTFIQIGFADSVAKPAFSSRMLQLKDDTNIVQRSSRIVKGRLVQQWAYLRLENASAAVVIENLALRLGNLKRDFDNMLQILAELQASHHMTSEVKSSKFDYVETCSSPTGTALNVIVNFTNGFHEDLCDLIENNEHSFLIHKIDCQVKQTNRAGSPSVPSTPSHSSDATETGSILQLYVVQMLFFHLHSMNQQIILLLRRQVSLLSMVNQEIQQQQQQQTSGRVDEMETLECMRCERLLNVGAGGSANSMSCHRVERSLTVNMTRHWTLFKKFNQAIAACTQRLDALMNNLEVTRVANAKHIQVFNKITGGDISDAESATHGLVSLRIKLNTEERPSLAEFVSLNEFASPTSEFLGILTCGLAGLIALITLWRVVEVKRILSQRPFPSSISEDNATSEVETTVNYFKTPSVTT